MAKNYVNNADFLEAIIKYKKLCQEAEDSGDEQPIVPNFIGTCLYQIANRLATKPNFSGYSYKDEMIADGLENAIQALNNFDPEKSSNPFAYFTQIIWYAFLRRIEKEKKQLYIRHKVVENSMIQGTIIEKESGDVEWMYESSDIIAYLSKRFPIYCIAYLNLSWLLRLQIRRRLKAPCICLARDVLQRSLS